MALLNAIATIFEVLLLLLRFLRDGELREQGREEVRQSQEEADAAAKETADQIDADVARSELDALRERMRDYQRTTP